MKKIIIYIIVNLALVAFLVCMGYVLSGTTFIQTSNLTIKMIFGLLNYAFAVLVVIELNRRIKKFLDSKLNSND